MIGAVTGGFSIREATDADLPAILGLYNALIPTTTIAWTDRLDTLPEREAWFAKRQAAGEPVLVAVDDTSGAVVGYTNYGPFRDNDKWPGYRYTAELTIHVAVSHHGTGIGRALVDALVERATANGIHVLVAAVDGANDGSVRFHERCGFTEVGRMPETGWKHDRWLELVLLQRVLDPGGRR